jgi:hypothetical protein
MRDRVSVVMNLAHTREARLIYADFSRAVGVD